MQQQASHRVVVKHANHLIEQHQRLFKSHPKQYATVEIFMQVITAFTNYERSLSIHTPLCRGSDADFELNLAQLDKLLAPPQAHVVAPLVAAEYAQ